MSADPAQFHLTGTMKNIVVSMGEALQAKGFLVFSGGDPRTFIGLQGDGEAGMDVWDKGNGFPVLSANRGKGGQPAIRVRKPGGGEDVAGLTAKDGMQGELTPFDAAGEVAKLGSLGGVGTLALSQAGKPEITLGPTPQKPTSALRAYGGGDMVLAAGATSSGSGVSVADGGDTVGASHRPAPPGARPSVASRIGRNKG